MMLLKQLARRQASCTHAGFIATLSVATLATLAGAACAEPVFAPDATLNPSTAVDADADGPLDGSHPGYSPSDAGYAYDSMPPPPDGPTLDGSAFDGSMPPPPDGPTLDGSPFDGGTDAGHSFCDGVPNAIFCDDFEGDLSRWAGDTNLGTVQRDVTRGYESGASYKSELMGAGTAQLNVVLPDSLAKGVTLYAQMRVWVPNEPLNKVSILWLGSVQGTALILQDWNAADSQIELNLFPWNTVHNNWIGSANFKPDRWTCLDIRIALDEKSEAALPTGVVETRIDDAVVITSGPIFTFEARAPFELRLGLGAGTPDQGAFTAWFDDVVVATEPLPPCSVMVPKLPDAGADSLGG